MEHDRRARLDVVLAELERRFGPWIIYRLGQRLPRADALAVSTGSLGLDWATGVGGVPGGRLTEFVGPPTSGKRALAAHVLANAQRDRGFVALIDASHTADFAQLQRCGVNLADLLLVVPTSTREAFDIASLLVASKGLDALVLSDANSLVAGPGGDSTAFAEGLRRLVAELAHAPTAVVILVQTAPFWGQYGRNADRALAHAATLRVEFTPVHLLVHAAGDVLGLRVQAKVIKNKLAPPYQEASLEVWHDHGIHVAAELFDLGLARGLIERTSAGYCFGATWLGRGRSAAITAIESDPPLATALRTALTEDTHTLALRGRVVTHG